MIEIDKSVFEQNLLLTQTYCELQLQKPFTNNASVLRTFNPDYNGKPLFSFGTSKYNSNTWTWNHANWEIDPLRGDKEQFYNQLFESQLQHKQTVTSNTFNDTAYKGKILIADIDQTIKDGASEANSDGFIDIFDCPPTDTWFYLTNDKYGRMMFGWVPEQFINIVQTAIDVNCVDCLSWYHEDFLQNREASYKEIEKRGRSIKNTGGIT